MDANWALGMLTDSQKRSVICLIAKKGKDQTSIGGWRPISLLNCDTKIFAKVLADGLKRVCKEVIGEEQLAYVEGMQNSPGRSHGDGQGAAASTEEQDQRPLRMHPFQGRF
jgi:hypothetical protein